MKIVNKPICFDSLNVVYILGTSCANGDIVSYSQKCVNNNAIKCFDAPKHIDCVIVAPTTSYFMFSIVWYIFICVRQERVYSQ